MKLGESVSLQLENETGDVLRISNVLFEVHLFVQGMYRYGFKLGVTDAEGRFHFSYSDLEKLRQNGAEFFLMDYNTSIEGCDSAIEVIVPSERELRDAATKAGAAFGKTPDWATYWPSNSQITAHPLKVDVKVGVNRAVVVCSPTSIL